MKSQILDDFRRDIVSFFEGIAIPHQPTTADDVYGPIKSEKVLKFNRKALKDICKTKKEKADPRLVGGEDRMIDKVGKPGSRERVEALRAMYEMYAAAGQEISAFYEE